LKLQINYKNNGHIKGLDGWVYASVWMRLNVKRSASFLA